MSDKPNLGEYEMGHAILLAICKTDYHNSTSTAILRDFLNGRSVDETAYVYKCGISRIINERELWRVLLERLNG